MSTGGASGGGDPDFKLRTRKHAAPNLADNPRFVSGPDSLSLRRLVAKAITASKDALPVYGEIGSCP